MILKRLALVTALICLPGRLLEAAPAAVLWPRWQAHDPRSTLRVGHGSWERFLGRYLDVDHPSGVHRVAYGRVLPADYEELGTYLDYLQQVPVSGLRRAEQKAYWINLYNATVVKVILDHYPVDNIRKINISPGLFQRGPWGAKILQIEGESLSLNDIEHRILRPIWKDERIHYAVNCASFSCPNLQPEAFTPQNTEALLERAAREYVNHSRGVDLQKDRLRLSSIYDWFKVDFGDSDQELLRHLTRYAAADLARRLEDFRGSIEYNYNWRLNE